eukprot:ctg_3144.g411
MSVSAVLIVDSRGRLLIARDYCGDVDVQAAAQAFASRLGDHDAPDTAFAPVMAVARGDYYLSSVRHQDVYLVAVQRSAYAAAATAIAFLHSLLSVLMDYLRRVNEESVRDNFVVIYELLDELMDYRRDPIARPAVGIVVGGHAAETAHRGDPVGELAAGGYPAPPQRGVLGRDRGGEHGARAAGQCVAGRGERAGDDQVFLVGHAGAETGSERQTAVAAVRKHRWRRRRHGNSCRGGGAGGRQVSPVRAAG